MNFVILSILVVALAFHLLAVFASQNFNPIGFGQLDKQVPKVQFCRELYRSLLRDSNAPIRPRSPFITSPFWWPWIWCSSTLKHHWNCARAWERKVKSMWNNLILFEIKHSHRVWINCIYFPWTIEESIPYTLYIPFFARSFRGSSVSFRGFLCPNSRPNENHLRWR